MLKLCFNYFILAAAGVTTGNGATPSKFVLRPSALDHQTVNFGKDMNNLARKSLRNREAIYIKSYLIIKTCLRFKFT